MKQVALLILFSVPVLAQAPDNMASGAMQRRIQKLKLLSLPGLEGRSVPEPKLAKQVLRRIRINHEAPCAITMPNATPTVGSAMPFVIPPVTANEKGGIIVPRVCGA